MTNRIPYIAVFETYREAEMGAREFLKTHYTVVKINKHGYKFVIKLRDGTEYIFMPISIYNKWYYGQTYRYIGTEELYHSGHRVGEKNESK